jgi:hypothetical protein
LVCVWSAFASSAVSSSQLAHNNPIQGMKGEYHGI